MTYQETIKWLEGVSLYGKKDGLTNMFQLMEELGNPHEKLQVVHVAGTNGKGTTCALLSGMLQAYGQKVGMFTSPHLVRYTERIRVNNCEIAPEEFARLAARVRAAAEKMEAEGKLHPTFFQLITAIAFLHFANEGVDTVVLEVGVGGRLDATNIVAKPLVSVIASISLDHTKVLGETIPAIAGEKAGIIKAGCPVVVCHNSDEAMQVFREKTDALGCPLYEADGLEYQVLSNDETGIALQVEDMVVKTHLCGDYQVENLKTALTAAKVLGIPAEAVVNGVVRTNWSGRMQRIAYEEHADLLLEGAHNEEGAAALGQWSRKHLTGTDTTLVFSALRKKDITSILNGLFIDTPFQRIIFARMDYDGGLSEEEFLVMAQPWLVGKEVEMVESVEKALALAYQVTAQDGLVLCAGSLYLVGEVLGLLERKGTHV